MKYEIFESIVIFFVFVFSIFVLLFTIKTIKQTKKIKQKHPCPINENLYICPKPQIACKTCVKLYRNKKNETGICPVCNKEFDKDDFWCISTIDTHDTILTICDNCNKKYNFKITTERLR